LYQNKRRRKDHSNSIARAHRKRLRLPSSLLIEDVSVAYPERLDQARLLFERVLGYANHLGLYAEQTGPQGEALGNFLQAFTHLALISAAFNLDRMLGSQV